MPVGLNEQQLQSIDDIVAVRKKIKRGGTLFRNGESFTSLYAIRTGFFKTCIATEDGRDQVTGFQMAGEIIGLDGIVNDHHTCDAVALEDAEVCVMPFDRIEEISREVTALQHHVHKIMSREIVREHGVMLLLGSMRAEERLAAFLLNLVQRLHARGFSQLELVLRMTREEIGSYLGLKLLIRRELFMRPHRRHACRQSTSGPALACSPTSSCVLSPPRAAWPWFAPEPCCQSHASNRH